MVRNARYLLIIPLLAACLGRATPPEQVKLTQQQNEVLGKFSRQVGEKEINILLKDPQDPVLPGLPVSDLLYVLSKINEDKLIQLVKGIGATTTLELLLEVKRIGCTRRNNYPTVGAYNFDARINTGSNGMNSCTWREYHLPNLLVQMLAGTTTNGLTTLIDSVKHSYTSLNCPSAPLPLAANYPLCVRILPATYDNPVRHHQYLMKLAYVVVSFDTPTTTDPNLGAANLVGPRKLYEVMNMAVDGRDMVYLIDSFDRDFNEAAVSPLPATCPNDATVGAVALTTASAVLNPSYKCARIADGTVVLPANAIQTYSDSGDLWLDIQKGYQLGGLKLLLDIMTAVTDGTKMGVILNGRRQTRYNTAEDEAQIVYYIDKLKVLLEHSRPVGCTFPGTGPETLAGTEQYRQNYASPHGGDAAWTAKLAGMINNINNPIRMMDLVYDIDISGTCPNRGIDNLLVMLNNINGVDPHPLVNAYPQTATNNEVRAAAYLIDNVALDPRNPHPAKRNKVRYLVENLGNTLDMLKLACYSAPADNNSGAAEVCDGRGLMNQVAAKSKFADPYSPAPTFPAVVVDDDLAGGRKLVNMTAQIYDMDDLRFLIKHVSMQNMSDLVSGLQISGTARVADLVNQISGDDCWAENYGLIKVVGPLATGGANITGNVSGGVVTSINVVSGGSAYPPGTAIAGFPGCTVQPVINLNISPLPGGVIQGSGHTIVSGGSGCTDGAAQPARLYKTNGFPTGSGYNVTNIPVPTFSSATVPTTVANSKAVVELDNTSPNFGRIMDVMILQSGAGYASSPSGVNFAPNLGGANITASATVGAFSGSCRYNTGTGEFRGFPSANGTGALGLGKMVNTINHISGSINNLVTLINGITDSRQLGVLINGVSRSSNLVGILNATIDTNRGNNANINDLMNMMNNIPLVDTYKLIHMMDNLGNAIELDATTTLPSIDHDMVAQLIAAYCRSDLAGLASATCPATVGNYVHRTSGLGYVAMSNLIKSLTFTGGGGYVDGAVVTGLGGSEGVLSVATAPAVNAVTGIEVNSGGSGCGTVTVTLIGGGGLGATAAAYTTGGVVSKVNILSSGSGYSSAPAVSFTGCATTPVATAYINGIGAVTVTKPGSGLMDSFVISPGGGSGAVITATVSGTINTLTSFAGGTGYNSGNVCPIVGAGGINGTCTVTATPAVNGALTGCAIVSGGNNYADGRIVRIGGRAEAVAVMSGGSITGYTITNPGCGYASAPTVTVTNTAGCTIAPAPGAATLNASGGIASIALGAGGTGCPAAIKVSIGDPVGAPAGYVLFSDGGSAIVNNVTAATGRVTHMSVSDASINTAQLVQLLDRDSTGQGRAFNYRADDGAWSPNQSGCSGGGAFPCPSGNTLIPNISTREGMIRLLHHGVTPTTTSSKADFNGAGGIGPGILSMDWPGIGPQHVAGSILNNVGSSSTQNLITLMNSDTVSLEDTIILLGCGDHVSYPGWWGPNTWQQLCTALGPGIW